MVVLMEEGRKFIRVNSVQNVKLKARKKVFSISVPLNALWNS
jgi:hypothetical protein